jgi:hypothetical protein
MSGRGRHSNRRGYVTETVKVRMTVGEIAAVDALRQTCGSRDHYNLVIESRSDVLRRLVREDAERRGR